MNSTSQKITSLQLKKLSDAAVPAAVKEQAKKLRSRWRQIVTGDEKKRIRDYIRETQDQPQYVKFFDKIAFTIGVLNMGVCQYFILNRPDLFPLWYAVVVPIMMLSRYAYFKHLAMQYFLIDFCYFVVTCSLINLLLVTNSSLFFKVCFIHGCGPLTLAIPTWRNSFVFHDYDKIVSVYVHILPCMLYYTQRWHGAGVPMLVTPSVSDLTTPPADYMCGSVPCEPLQLLDYAVALGMYLFWQTCYLVKTEYLDKRKLDDNPHLLTSLRWMSADTKNPLARAILKVLRKVGMFAKDEEYDSKTLKTKLAFVGSQFLYTLIAFLPTPFMYNSANFHVLYILLIIVNSVYNGASFYIEVFSKRYMQHIDKIEEMHKIAKEASSMAKEIEELQKEQQRKWGKPVRADRIPIPVGITARRNNPGSKDAGLAGADDVRSDSTSSGTTDAEELSEIASLLKQTSEDAWVRMREQAEEAEEFRRNFSGDFMVQYSAAMGDEEDDSTGSAGAKEETPTEGFVLLSENNSQEELSSHISKDENGEYATKQGRCDKDDDLLDELSNNPDLQRERDRALTIDR